MVEEPDFRTDPMESTEGSGIAVARWRAWHYSLPDEVVEEAFSTPARSIEDFDPDIQDDIAENARERSELLGFWLAWHLAGGFDNLVRSGWHRATVFRKVRTFRTAYGVHPDDFSLPWLKLDLKAAWADGLTQRLKIARGDFDPD